MIDMDIYFIPCKGFVIDDQGDIIYNVEPEEYIMDDGIELIYHNFNITSLSMNDDNGIKRIVFITDMYGHVMYNNGHIKYFGNITSNKRVKELFRKEGFSFAGIFNKNKKPYYINNTCECFSVDTKGERNYVDMTTLLNFEKPYYSQNEVYFFRSIGFITYDTRSTMVEKCYDVYYTKPSNAKNFEFTGIIYKDAINRFHKILKVKFDTDKVLYVYQLGDDLYMLLNYVNHKMYFVEHPAVASRIICNVSDDTYYKELDEVRKKILENNASYKRKCIVNKSL